jgi:alkylhydroperoxidase family enzyme
LVRTGLTDEVISQLDDYETSDLPDSWKAALRLTDHLSGPNAGTLKPSVYNSLSEHFTEPQILMLGALLAVGSGWQRMIEAFGIRPDHYTEGQVGPWVNDGQ